MVVLWHYITPPLKRKNVHVLMPSFVTCLYAVFQMWSKGTRPLYIQTKKQYKTHSLRVSLVVEKKPILALLKTEI